MIRPRPRSLGAGFARPGPPLSSSSEASSSTGGLFVRDLPAGRDLGGLPLGESHAFAHGTFARSGRPDALPGRSKRRLVTSGLRTAIDLRSPGEDSPVRSFSRRVDVLSISLHPVELWEEYRGKGETWKLSTPIYYTDYARRYSPVLIEVLSAIAFAKPGGVLVHCAAGRDRTGLVVAVLLRALGASHEVIIEDHWLSIVKANECSARASTPVESSAVALPRAEHADHMHTFLQSREVRSIVERPARDELVARLRDRFVVNS